MAECKDCGKPLPTDADLCPHCGDTPGAEAMTEMPGAKVKESDHKLRDEIHATAERVDNINEAECKNCGGLFAPTNEICPHCGETAGSAETLSDYPRVDFKAARKQLKEEIKEAKEHRKE
jgi:uncharacterized OB-fold protein